MNNLKEFKKLPLFIIPFLIIACGPSLSKEQRRQIDEFKRYVKENRNLINISSERFGIPINYTIVNNYAFLLKWVIRQNADVNVKGRRGATPLHKSIICDHTKNLNIISILIKSGANVNSVDNYRNTPLHTAVSFGKVKAVDLLISHGADVNARANGGETPLHYAARQPFDPSQDRIGAAKLLLQSGAHINEKDYFGRTPLIQSSMVGNEEMTAFLLKVGANSNLVTDSGESSLHIAAANGHSIIAKLLIEYGAKVNHNNNEGMTPFCRALHTPAIRYNSQGSAPVDTTEVEQVLREFGGIE